MVVVCSCSISGVPFGTHWDPFADGARANKSRLKKQAVQIMTTLDFYLWWPGQVVMMGRSRVVMMMVVELALQIINSENTLFCQYQACRAYTM